MSWTALFLASLLALPAQAQLRSAPVRAPVLAPTLAAPQAPTLAVPGLTASPALAAPALALPRITVPTAVIPKAAAAQASASAAPPAARASLSEAVKELAAGEAAQAPALHALFSGTRLRPANAAAVLGAGGSGRAPLRLRPAATGPAARASEPVGPPLDSDGSRMSAALRELKGRSAQEPLAVGFLPTPASLKEMSKLDHEVFLFRERGTGLWRLAGGERWGVSGDFGDYDLGLHNHPDMRLGVHSLYSPYPSPQDLLNAAGKDARVFVVSVKGVAEWNTAVPFPDEPGRFLPSDASEAEASEWVRRLESGSWLRRLVMKLTFPEGYPSLARSLGVAMELRPWRKVTQEWLDSGAPPETAQTMSARLAPAFAEEAALAADRLAGRTLSAEERAAVVGRTRLSRVGWAKRLFNEFGVMASYPDGVARPDLSIELTERPSEGLPDPEAYYRVLFAHEYTHRMQFEGHVTKRWGIEVPPVAVELLRGLELVGMEGLRAGRIPFVTENTLSGFDSGRAWADGPRTDDAVFHFKGAMAGAAWALAARTGRPADAWEFVRRTSSQERRERPSSVFEEILMR